MSADPVVPGLRERKKVRTRATIRSEAFRLFEEQGYAETTIEQIAQAADVSPSTFFRYFPTKEQLVLADDLDALMIEAFEAQPADVPLFTAFIRASEGIFENLPPEEIEFENRRQKLLSSVPELKRAMWMDLNRTIDLLAGMIAKRSGRALDDFEVRATAGAMFGAVIGVLDQADGDMSVAMEAIKYVADGLPFARGT
jgi:AcrR family transcriptional regulator